MSKAAVLPSLSFCRRFKIAFKDKVKGKRYYHQYNIEHREKISAYNKKYNQEHAKEIAICKKKLRRKYRLDWLAFFKEKYGETPKCEICNKELRWEGKRAEVVHFDHRNDGGAPIKESPAVWWLSRSCTLIYQKIWNECDFGVLCNNCNHWLPTIDRKHWIQRAIKYINKQGGNRC